MDISAGLADLTDTADAIDEVEAKCSAEGGGGKWPVSRPSVLLCALLTGTKAGAGDSPSVDAVTGELIEAAEGAGAAVPMEVAEGEATTFVDAGTLCSTAAVTSLPLSIFSCHAALLPPMSRTAPISAMADFKSTGLLCVVGEA